MAMRPAYGRRTTSQSTPNPNQRGQYRGCIRAGRKTGALISNAIQRKETFYPSGAQLAINAANLYKCAHKLCCVDLK
jgi:hypothetical protein